MKFTTYGMFEKSRGKFVKKLVHFFKGILTAEKVDAMLLEPIITQINDHTNYYQKHYQQNMPFLDFRQNLMFSFKKSLDVILPSMALLLDMTEAELKPFINPWIDEMHSIWEINLNNLLELVRLNEEIKYSVVDELYGPAFKVNYPDLYESLLYNDKDVIRISKRLMDTAIFDMFSEDTLDLMHEHFLYVEELASQEMSIFHFHADFMWDTGQSMEDFKRNIRLQYTLSSRNSRTPGLFSQEVKVPDSFDDGLPECVI